MMVKKIMRALIVWLCVFILLMPFCSKALAVTALTESSTKATIESIPARQGGCSYKIGDHDVLKVTQAGDASFLDVFYCVNAEKSLSLANSGYNYRKVANDFTNYSDTEVKSWANSLGVSEAHHRALVYLFNNIYLLNHKEYKDEFLKKAFAKYIEEQGETIPPTTIDTIKEKLTDDDIDVVQQWAVWYFTNSQELGGSTNQYRKAIYDSFATVTLNNLVGDIPGFTTGTTDMDHIRQEYMQELYNYLITSARQATEKTEITNKTYPHIDKNTTAVSAVDGEYYKVGPFKINSGNTVPSDLQVTLTSEGGTLSDYKIYVDGSEVDKELDKILGKNFYVYIPIEGNTITNIKLTLSYTTDEERKISLWDKEESEVGDLQPLVLILSKPGEHVSEETSGRVDQKEYDLALRKYIVSVNGIATTGKEPVVSSESLDKLANGTEKTAEYKHSKASVTVKKGDKIVYEFRIYNEGELPAKVSKLVDYLPDGLEMISSKESTVNQKADWQDENGEITTDFLKNETIPAFDKTSKTLSFIKIQLECKVTGDFETGKILTNIAEIKVDDGNDRDSQEGTITPSQVTEDYKGNDSNPSDLSDSNYFYKGIEDDDDFDKLIIRKDLFDLNLKKFISKINKDKISTKEPKPDITPLNNGADDADYVTNKSPINVETGDVITFTLRVYNEGDISGYAEEITDYIPEGLGFIENYGSNTKWNKSDDATIVKLSTIKNGKNNVSLDDFTDVTDLDEVNVVLGKTKLTTNAFSSDNKDNLIEAFDGNSLHYKDVEIACIVVAEDEVTLKNIAAITGETDENKNKIDTDRGSENRDSTPRDDIDPDNYGTGNEDDDDYDVVKTSKENFDLALQKFITGVNEDTIKNREPSVTKGNDGNIEYNHPKEALKVNRGDLITYTIRVYNEGDIDGYAAEIADNIPEGLIFIPDNDTNLEYGWKMYDNSGKETENVSEAVEVRTQYLSKENSENNLIPAFDKNKDISDSNPSFKDVKLVFRIDENLSEENLGKALINIAEITKNTDKDGNDIPDIDSTPDNGNPNEDDIDKEQVYVEKEEDLEFDLNLKKFISKVNNENLAREPKVDVTPLNNESNDAKYDMSKDPVSVEAGDIVTFTLRVYNEGDIAGYAEEITDYIPEGLGFLEGYGVNREWSTSEDAKKVKISTIKNGTKNVKISDFNGVNSLENVNVVLGKAKVTNKSLSSESNDNLIDAFNGKELKYKDVQIACIVVAEDDITLKNIAAITAEKDKDKNPVDKDRDSTPKDDIDPDKYGTGNEDDDDYDVVKQEKKDFDLALQKFITGLNDSEVTNRVPSVVMGSDGKLQYNHPTDALKIHNGDLIKYTIRVYNEGEVDGYADEVGDDIPKGLVFVPDNETNVKYEWKMYDKSGNETKDASQAVSVKTNYLSKTKSENNLIPAFNKDAGVSGTNPSFKDVELVFKIDESLINKTVTTSERTLVNIAEITKTTDKDGNDIPDIDSTPGNGDPNEDDIDKEQVYVEYFDLSLEKDLSKALVTVDGKTTELNVAKGETIKVDVNRKKLSTTAIKFVYNITVKNEGEVEGFATEVTDYIPQGLSFNKADNPDWEQASERVITTNALAKTLLQPGQSATVSVILTWDRSEQNMGEFLNVAEITEHWNPYGSPDVDSTPKNAVPTEDDYDDAPVYVSIITGLGERPYIVLTSVVLAILGTGIVLIKKYVL